MKSTTTILAVAIVAFLGAGLAAVAWANHPSFSTQRDHCCNQPAPEDIRYYFVELPPNEIEVVVIPEVEGQHGFIITDLSGGPVGTPNGWREDTGGGPINISVEGTAHFESGIPVEPGSSISVLISTAESWPRYVSISGYVY